MNGYSCSLPLQVLAISEDGTIAHPAIEVRHLGVLLVFPSQSFPNRFY